MLHQHRDSLQAHAVPGVSSLVGSIDKRPDARAAVRYTATFLPAKGRAAVLACPACTRYCTRSEWLNTGAADPSARMILRSGWCSGKTQHGSMQNGLPMLFACRRMGSVAWSGCSPTSIEQSWTTCTSGSFTSACFRRHNCWRGTRRVFARMATARVHAAMTALISHTASGGFTRHAC